jgi:hypothetical protein
MRRGNPALTRQIGKSGGNGEKDTFRGNELSYLLQLQELAFLGLSKRTGFDANELKSNPK